MLIDQETEMKKSIVKSTFTLITSEKKQTEPNRNENAQFQHNTACIHIYE